MSVNPLKVNITKKNLIIFESVDQKTLKFAFIKKVRPENIAFL